MEEHIQSKLKFYQFYCWLHVSAYVKSHHLVIENTQRRIIELKHVRINNFPNNWDFNSTKIGVVKPERVVGEWRLISTDS
jgi:hypothetical protein